MNGGRFLRKVMVRFAWAPAIAVVASAGVLAGTAADAPRWKDPLDTPAVSSALASTTQLLSVAVAGKRMVAVGWRGHILVSDDGGAHWKQVPSPVSADLTSVSFVSPELGWAVGHGGVVLHTQDGGLTWRVQTDGRATAKTMVAYYEKLLAAGSGEAEKLLADVKLNTKTGADQPWLDVQFLDPSHGYVTGSFGMFMGTADGGKSWTPLQDKIDNPNGLHLTGIARTEGDVYIASEQGTVFHKGPASDRFTALQTGYAGTFFGIAARQDVIIVYGLRGTAYRSDDRGRTWAPLRTGVSTGITGGQILDDGSVLLVTQGGDLLAAPPAGTSFSRQKTVKSYLFADIAPAQDGRAAIVGTAGVFVQPLGRPAR